eukprot:8751098-Alexandrium_andersonii.AAC.1
MVFAKRLNAGDEHMTQLSNLMANISTSRSSGAAPISADGGGARAAADVSGDVEMVVDSTASAEGGGGATSAPQ